MSGPARNRVSPSGDILGVAGRGAWMGNRGVLHAGRTGAGSRDIVRTSRSRAWIICALSFKGRTLPQWEPGRNTQLFFLDEAVALAAGHRPCAECRRPAYNAFRTAWAAGADPLPYAKDLDRQLDSERGPLHRSTWPELPDGAFVVTDDGPAVLVGDQVTHWQPDNTYGYRGARPRQGLVQVITPPASLRALRNGYPVQLDPVATG